jgi:hypothetical protein
MKWIAGRYYYGRDYGAHEWIESGNTESLVDGSIPEGMDEDLIKLQEAHHLTKLALNYAFPSGKMNLNFYVENLEDYPEKTGFIAGEMKINAPRTLGAVLSVRF